MQKHYRCKVSSLGSVGYFFFHEKCAKIVSGDDCFVLTKLHALLIFGDLSLVNFVTEMCLVTHVRIDSKRKD